MSYTLLTMFIVTEMNVMRDERAPPAGIVTSPPLCEEDLVDDILYELW